MVSSVVQITTEDGYHRLPLDVHPVDHLRRESVSPLLKSQLATGLVFTKRTQARNFSWPYEARFTRMVPP